MIKSRDEVRKEAMANNNDFVAFIKVIESEIDKAAANGSFECKVKTEIYNNDVLNCVVRSLESLGYSARWELIRGNNCKTRLFTISWW